MPNIPLISEGRTYGRFQNIQNLGKFAVVFYRPPQHDAKIKVKFGMQENT